MTLKATRARHGWVHMFTTHWPTLTLQLHNFDLFRTCRTALLRGNLQDFNWNDASRGPSAIAELPVRKYTQLQWSRTYTSTEKLYYTKYLIIMWHSNLRKGQDVKGQEQGLKPKAETGHWQTQGHIPGIQTVYWILSASKGSIKQTDKKSCIHEITSLRMI